MNGQNELCITNEILEEYSGIIGKLINAEIADYVIGSIINCPFVQCVDCALAIGASYIVSNDHHYDILKTIDYPQIDVIGIKEFYERYRNELISF